MELAILRSLNCKTPTGRNTPIADLDVRNIEFPQHNNEPSPLSSPSRLDIEMDDRPADTPMSFEPKYIGPKTPETIAKDKTEPLISQDWPSIPIPSKDKNHDIRNMESSAAEALMTLAGQDNIIRHKSPGPIQPNIIRALQGMSSKYINNEPILKESEKIEMFSEIPTTDSEEESLEIRRLR